MIKLRSQGLEELACTENSITFYADLSFGSDFEQPPQFFFKWQLISKWKRQKIKTSGVWKMSKKKFKKLRSKKTLKFVWNCSITNNSSYIDRSLQRKSRRDDKEHKKTNKDRASHKAPSLKVSKRKPLPKDFACRGGNNFNKSKQAFDTGRTNWHKVSSEGHAISGQTTLMPVATTYHKQNNDIINRSKLNNFGRSTDMMLREVVTKPEIQNIFSGHLPAEMLINTEKCRAQCAVNRGHDKILILCLLFLVMGCSQFIRSYLSSLIKDFSTESDFSSALVEHQNMNVNIVETVEKRLDDENVAQYGRGINAKRSVCKWSQGTSNNTIKDDSMKVFPTPILKPKKRTMSRYQRAKSCLHQKRNIVELVESYAKYSKSTKIDLSSPFERMEIYAYDISGYNDILTLQENATGLQDCEWIFQIQHNFQSDDVTALVVIKTTQENDRNDSDSGVTALSLESSLADSVENDQSNVNKGMPNLMDDENTAEMENENNHSSHKLRTDDNQPDLSDILNLPSNIENNTNSSRQRDSLNRTLLVGGGKSQQISGAQSTSSTSHAKSAYEDDTTIFRNTADGTFQDFHLNCRDRFKGGTSGELLTSKRYQNFLWDTGGFVVSKMTPKDVPQKNKKENNSGQDVKNNISEDGFELDGIEYDYPIASKQRKIAIAAEENFQKKVINSKFIFDPKTSEMFGSGQKKVIKIMADPSKKTHTDMDTSCLFGSGSELQHYIQSTSKLPYVIHDKGQEKQEYRDGHKQSIQNFQQINAEEDSSDCQALKLTPKSLAFFTNNRLSSSSYIYKIAVKLPGQPNVHVIHKVNPHGTKYTDNCNKYIPLYRTGIHSGNKDDLLKFVHDIESSDQVINSGVLISEDLQKVPALFKNFEENEHFTVIKTLGRGTYGTAFLYQTTIPGSNRNLQFVLKKIHRRLFNAEEVLIPVHHAEKCEQILDVYGVVVENEYVNILMEYAEGGTIESVLKNSENRWAISDIAKCIEALLKGLKYLHANDIVVYDMKIHNIVLRNPRDPTSVAIIDWGSSKCRSRDSDKRPLNHNNISPITVMMLRTKQGLEKRNKSEQGVVMFARGYIRLINGNVPFDNGTPHLLPPEYNRIKTTNRFTDSLKALDMWCLGGVLYWCLGKSHVWEKNWIEICNIYRDSAVRKRVLREHITSQGYDIYHAISKISQTSYPMCPALVHLLTRLLDPCPDTRISATEALQHSIFHDLKPSDKIMVITQTEIEEKHLIQPHNSPNAHDVSYVWVTVVLLQRIVAHIYVRKGISIADFYRKINQHIEEFINEDSEQGYCFLKQKQNIWKIEENCVLEVRMVT